MKKYILVLAVIVFAGCNGGVNKQVEEKIQKNVVSVIGDYKLPPQPDPVENSKTFKGVDSDGNGVRDDLDILIASKAQNRVDYEMAKDYVKNFTEAVSEPSKAYTEKRYQIMGISYSCAAYLEYSYPELYREIILKNKKLKDDIINTKDREEQLTRYKEALNGHILTERKINSSDDMLLDCPKYIQEKAKTMKREDPLK